MPSESRKRELVVPFNTHVRVEPLPADAGVGATRIPEAPELTNHIGSVHGGALFTVGEAASGRAFVGALVAAFDSGDPGLIPVVKTASIQFLKVARGEISARGSLVTPLQEVLAGLREQGKSTAWVEVQLTDSEGRAVAAMQVEWHVRHAQQQ